MSKKAKDNSKKIEEHIKTVMYLMAFDSLKLLKKEKTTIKKKPVHLDADGFLTLRSNKQKKAKKNKNG